MSEAPTELYVLYQIGASEDWVWFSPIGAFLTEDGLREFAKAKGAPAELRMLTVPSSNVVTLEAPQDFVAVRTSTGELPEVELNMEAQDRIAKKAG